jgi:hypothetical protein
MTCRFNNGFNGNNGFANTSFAKHISEFLGRTVTIFTTSGGASGCGFTGVLIGVNCDFVRLSTLQGTPPDNPLSEEICDFDNGNDYDGCESGNFKGIAGGMAGGIGGGIGGNLGGIAGGIGGGIGGAIGGGIGSVGGQKERRKKEKRFRVGSVCDIPIDRIAAFCHNAI